MLSGASLVWCWMSTLTAVFEWDIEEHGENYKKQKLRSGFKPRPYGTCIRISYQVLTNGPERYTSPLAYHRAWLTWMKLESNKRQPQDNGQGWGLLLRLWNDMSRLFKAKTVRKRFAALHIIWSCLIRLSSSSTRVPAYLHSCPVIGYPISKIIMQSTDNSPDGRFINVEQMKLTKCGTWPLTTDKLQMTVQLIISDGITERTPCKAHLSGFAPFATRQACFSCPTATTFPVVLYLTLTYCWRR